MSIKTSTPKRHILYFDDEDTYLEKLEEAHRGNYCIKHIDDLKKLKAELETRAGTKEWPEILLLDVG